MNVPFSEFWHLNGQTFLNSMYMPIFSLKDSTKSIDPDLFGQKVWTRTRPNLVSGQAQFQRVCFDRILYSNTANSRQKGHSFVTASCH